MVEKTTTKIYSHICRVDLLVGCTTTGPTVGVTSMSGAYVVKELRHTTEQHAGSILKDTVQLLLLQGHESWWLGSASFQVHYPIVHL